MDIPKLAHISLLKDIDQAKKICKSLAMLDALIMPEWEYRYFSYNSKWDTGREMASMRDGQGSEYFILFADDWACGKLFSIDEERRVGEADIDRGVTHMEMHFSEFINEPAFSTDDFSIFFWRNRGNSGWSAAPYEDEIDFLSFLTGDIDLYHQWAEFYYDQRISRDNIAHILDYNPIDNNLIETINPDLDLFKATDDIIEIDYPAIE